METVFHNELFGTQAFLKDEETEARPLTVLWAEQQHQQNVFWDL